MDTVKALEILKAPQAVRFYVLAFESWKSSVERQIKLAATLEWFAEKLKEFNNMMEIRNNNLAIEILADEETLRQISTISKELPTLPHAKVDIDLVKDCLTKAYAAGVTQGSKMVMEPQNLGELGRQKEALEIVQAEIAKIQNWIAANVLVDKSGRIVELKYSSRTGKPLQKPLTV